MSRVTIYGDRTVHARSGELEIVRYDRAGKWYVEFDPPRMRPAFRVSLREAASLAVDRRAEVFFGKPGGGSFDRLFSRLLNDDVAKRAAGVQG